MSQWLKWRLVALFCAVTLCGGATYLHAQNGAPPPAKTPEAAGEAFYAFLAAGEKSGSALENGAPNFDIGRGVQYLGAVSLTPFLVGSTPRSLGRPERFFALLAAQAKTPQFSGRVTGKDGDKILVEVAPTAMAKPREVVVVAEDGGYRVDTIATYGRWNNLSGPEIEASIYRNTGLALGGLQGDSNFTRSNCQSNLKQIGLGIAQYTQDYDEHLPRARAWNDILQPYLKSRQIFTCPALPAGKTGGYAFNQNLSQFSLLKIDNPSTTIAVYETSNLSPNAFGPGTGRAYRHQDGSNLGFVDGHVKWLRRGEESQSSFKP